MATYQSRQGGFIDGRNHQLDHWGAHKHLERERETLQQQQQLYIRSVQQLFLSLVDDWMGAVSREATKMRLGIEFDSVAV